MPYDRRMDSRLFAKNLDVLKQVHPQLFLTLGAELEKFHSNTHFEEKFEWCKTATDQPNLRYQRNSPPCVMDCHGPDPSEEARKIIASVDIQNAQILFLFGFGLGYLLKSFLRIRQPKNFAVFVAEKNPQIFLHALAAFDWTNELADKTIYWCIGGTPPENRNKLHNFFLSHSTARSLRMVAQPQVVGLDPEYYHYLVGSITPTRAQALYQHGNNVPDSIKGFTNTLANFPRIYENPGLARLKNQFQGKVCISLAAGPDLNHHWETLRKLGNKIPIIACDTTLKPLSNHGIEADIITAIERDLFVSDFFKGIPIPKRTTLIAPPLLIPESLSAFDGDQVYYAQAVPFSEILGLDFLGRFFPAWSSGNMNINLATYMGFSTIIMVGHNLAYAYKTQESHVRGTVDPDRERPRNDEEILNSIWSGEKIRTQDGTDEVWTNVHWNMYRYHIEYQIVENPSVTFITTSPKGARIAGATLMSLPEAIEKYGQEKFDLYPVKRKLLEGDPTKDQRKKPLADIRKDTQQVISNTSEWLRVGREMILKIEDWSRQIEIQKNNGNPVSLAWLDRALDQVLSVKVQAIENDPIFQNTSGWILRPDQLAFERDLHELFAKHTNDYDLKVDFLMTHLKLFKFWDQYLPLILEALQNFEKSTLEKSRDGLSYESAGRPENPSTVTSEHGVN